MPPPKPHQQDQDWPNYRMYVVQSLSRIEEKLELMSVQSESRFKEIETRQDNTRVEVAVQAAKWSLVVGSIPLCIHLLILWLRSGK